LLRLSRAAPAGARRAGPSPVREENGVQTRTYRLLIGLPGAIVRYELLAGGLVAGGAGSR